MSNILTEKEVYAKYRAAQAQANNRGWRMPKNWKEYFECKMKPYQREALRKLRRYFATVWQNIDPDTYFKYGFELWKSFSYHQFFDERLINYYIQKDKNKKRKTETSKKTILASAKYVKKFMIDNDIKTLKQYSRKQEGFMAVPISHYLKNKIDNILLVFLITKKYILLTDEERGQIPQILGRYRELRQNMYDVKPFLDKIEATLTF